MERRTESSRHFTDLHEDGSKESDKTRNHSRSRQENGKSSIGEREEKSKNRRGNRKPRRDRSNRRIVRNGERAAGRKKSIPRGGRKYSKKNTKEVTGLSDMSRTIITKRLSRRRTRASIHPTHKYKRNKKIENVPSIPKRVFKALHILRHEKFLRVASRYLKPEN